MRELKLMMAEAISDGDLGADSAEEGEIRDSDEEKALRKSEPEQRRVRPTRSPPRSTHRSRVDKRRPKAPPPPPRRRKRRREEEKEDDEDDVDAQIAKTRRRRQLVEATLPLHVEKQPDVPAEDEIEEVPVPPKTFELVQIDDEDALPPVTNGGRVEEDNERENELLQLRLVALKSSLEAKWGHKKRASRIDEPYSPTGPLEPVEGVEELDSPAPSPPQSPSSLSGRESEEDEETLRLTLLQQINKNSAEASEDKENDDCHVESSNVEGATMGPPLPKSDNSISQGAVNNSSNTPNGGRFIISIGPDSSDSESESDRDSAQTSGSDIDEMLKKLRQTVEQPKTKATPSPRSRTNGNLRKSPARQMTPITKNNPLSALPKSRQAEYLRLKALLKKKEELRRQRIQKAADKKEAAKNEPSLPSLSALSQALPLLSEEQRFASLQTLEADYESQRERSKEQNERLAAMVERLDSNKSAQQEATAEAEAAETQQREQEARIALLRRQLAEAEAAAAATAEQINAVSAKQKQLKLEEAALEASVGAARVEAARLRAGCALLREACAQARGDNEVRVLEQQLDVLGAMTSGPLSYQSPLDHIRVASAGALDPHREVCPDFLSGTCSRGNFCALQHP
ncbi:ABC transporter F family member 4-like isoform X2 [Neocloeon triangulifer]|uniref:ABC transporter F family member 4-like isoform X2 n=1 Tax=Neocloeon triangulifer TaxID=2078957 RepID=UPI00286F0CB7|nr:ABC transporter F family member 4-like isoform X2 [Neocloeon triangulifer]